MKKKQLWKKRFSNAQRLLEYNKYEWWSKLLFKTQGGWKNKFIRLK